MIPPERCIIGEGKSVDAEGRKRPRGNRADDGVERTIIIFMPGAARGFGRGTFSVNVQCTYGCIPHVIHVYIHTCTRAFFIPYILLETEEQARERSVYYRERGIASYSSYQA